MSLEEAVAENTRAIMLLNDTLLQGNLAPAATTEKKKRRTKAEIAADEAAVEAEATPETPPAASLDLDIGGEKPATEEPVTLETLKANGMLLVGCGTNQAGLGRAKELIANYGAKLMDEVKPEDYSKLNAEFIKEAKNWGKKSAVNTQL